MDNSKTIIKLENVTKDFNDGQVKVLKDINLRIKEGEFISIIGPSGSGKSTLLHILGALDYPSSGKVMIDGMEINKKQNLSKLRSEKLGFIFQLHNLIPYLPVVDNVEIPLLATSTSEKEKTQKALELLDKVGLSEHKNKKPTQLSGGQRQRVAIARALVNNPSIILADEPTGSLDSENGKNVLKLLREIHDENNVTLIIVTHDNDIANTADRRIKIKDGMLVEDEILK